MFIDTHAHVDFEKFDEDREAVIGRAFAAKVWRIINISCDMESARRGIALAEKYEGIFATVGIHPAEGEQMLAKVSPPSLKLRRAGKSEQMLQLADLIRSSKKIVAVGEIGVDYYWMKRTVEEQQMLLREQLRVAREFGLPVVIHCRKGKSLSSSSSYKVYKEQSEQKLEEVSRGEQSKQSEQKENDPYEDCFRILQEEQIKAAVFHCFSGSLEFAKKAWEQGYMTSFTGIITYPKSEDLRLIVKECPLDKMMIETDCPFLAPQKYRGQRNEPAYVVEVAKKIAEIKGISLEEVEELTTRNAESFFRL